MNREAWWATVHRVAKSWTRLKRLSMPKSWCNLECNGWCLDLFCWLFWVHFKGPVWWLLTRKLFCIYSISTLLKNWRLRRVMEFVRKSPWRKAWQPTLAFSPGESCEQRSLVSYKSIVSQRVRHGWSDLALTHPELSVSRGNISLPFYGTCKALLKNLCLSSAIF